MPIFGVQTKLAFVRQNSYDVIGDISNSAVYLPFLSENLTVNREELLSQSIEGVYDEKERYAGKYHVSGDIEVEAQAKSIGHLISMALNGNSSITSDSVIGWTFTPGQTAYDAAKSWNRPHTISKETVGDGDQNLYNLCASSIEFNLEAGGFLKSKVSLVGGTDGEATNTGASSYYAADDQFTWDNSSVFIGSTVFEPSAISFTLTEPIEPQWTIQGSYWPRSNNLNGFRDINFNMTIPWNNNSDYTRFFDEIGSETLTLNRRGETEIQSGYYNELRITAAKPIYESFEASAGGPGEIELSVSGRAQYDSNSSYAMDIFLQNIVTVY